MTNRPMLAVTVLVIALVGIATWILASHTVGESLDPRNSTSIGFSIALLAIATAASLLFLSNATEKPGSRLGLILVICGTACILVALALQFYVTSVLAANSQRVADILRERGGNVNLNFNLPKSVESIAYCALFAGVWLAAVGIRIGVGREGLATVGAASIATGQPGGHGGATETGIREGNA
jgi:MFS family permease